ncbi:unnamed protein product [Lampetra fluviatilis]
MRARGRRAAAAAAAAAAASASLPLLPGSRVGGRAMQAPPLSEATPPFLRHLSRSVTARHDQWTVVVPIATGERSALNRGSRTLDCRASSWSARRDAGDAMPRAVTFVGRKCVTRKEGVGG